MPRTKPVNPFYAVLAVAGVTFALTAAMYGVMTVRSLDSRGPEAVGVVAFMDRHGMTLMGVELAVLAVLTVAAMWTDDYWTKGAAKKDQDKTS